MESCRKSCGSPKFLIKTLAFNKKLQLRRDIPRSTFPIDINHSRDRGSFTGPGAVSTPSTNKMIKIVYDNYY